ncbi:MAG: hypothetical protein PHI23_02935 [Candidatus Peribacteraceae bacterium]|nr:hypothetical protein [Candidatus Peribacteraceae bacterium]
MILGSLHARAAFRLKPITKQMLFSDLSQLIQADTSKERKNIAPEVSNDGIEVVVSLERVLCSEINGIHGNKGKYK